MFIFKIIPNVNFKNMIVVSKKISTQVNKCFIIIIIDMIICGLKYGAGYYDYLEFEFYKLNNKQRKTYITRGINNKIIKKYNKKEFFYQFDDKIEFNKIFNDYLKREWIYLDTYLNFIKFVENKTKIVAKPIDGVGGIGVEIIEITTKTNLKNLYKKLTSNKQLLLEEFVIQHDDMNKLYNKSVNTLRIFTFNCHTKVVILNSVLKIGNGESVDNFSSGGMYCFINKNGKTKTKAIDQNDNIYSTHPISKTNIVDFKIPMYQDAINLVKKASKISKEVKYIGWDVAISKKGPVLIEGNCFPGIFQEKPQFNKKKEGLLPLYKKHMDI